MLLDILSEGIAAGDIALVADIVRHAYAPRAMERVVVADMIKLLSDIEIKKRHFMYAYLKIYLLFNWQLILYPFADECSMVVIWVWLLLQRACL